MIKLTPPFRTMVRSHVIFPTALIVAVASSAAAGPVGFTVGGTTYSVSKFDELPGNALSINALSLIDAAGPTGTTGPITTYYQARVILEDANDRALAVPGQVTILARFNETATNSVENGLPVSTFNLASNQVGSYIKLYYNATIACNDLTGKGFGPDAAGSTLIYSGLVPTSGALGHFKVTSPAPTSYDQSPGAASDGYADKLTIVGSGGTTLSVGPAFLDSTYLTSGMGTGTTFNFSSVDQTPFDVAPSESFYDVTTGTYITPSLSFVNGLYQASGPPRQDFQFVVDGTSSFAIAAVPEPASIALTAIGLVGLGIYAARRRAAARA